MAVHEEGLITSAGARRRVRVWDPFLRLFHWSVAIAFFIAYVSEDELLTLHVWSGHAIGALVVLRILWGFVGPRHARFSDFVTGPWTALRYLLGLLTSRARRHLGHSPAGGVMVLLLLAGLLGTVISGMALHAIENDAGPLTATARPTGNDTSPEWLLSSALVRAARADEAEHEKGWHGYDPDEGAWEEIHEVFANLTMVLVILHVLGVILASVIHRENLVRSMFSGTKRPD